ncbi:MAG: hypothetical protein KDN19_16310 [Verrucomicrobiae bacterium]|nr:hypothetical protein [Verrucomicrobiae bacterium]
MKFKTLLIAGAVALLGSATGFTADVEINFTGSTAFRSAAHATILDVLGGQGVATYAFDGSTLGGAGKALFEGTFNGKTYLIRTSWSGSTAGIASVADQTDINVIDEGTVTLTTAGTQLSGAATKAVKAQFSFSDVGVALSSNPTANLGGGPVGVVPFAFFASATAPAEVDNMTDQIFAALYSGGQMPLSTWTNNPADDPVANPGTGRYVLPFGRDAGSGTRATTLAETQYGAFTQVLQYGEDTAFGGAGQPVTNLGTIGNGGQSSGGTLRNIISADFSNVGGFNFVAIGYLGAADGATVIQNGGKMLKYNGVDFSIDNIINGSYTFWGYQQLLTIPVLDADQQAFDTALRAAIPNNLGSNFVAISAMKVTRNGGDGGPVSPN